LKISLAVLIVLVIAASITVGLLWGYTVPQEISVPSCSDSGIYYSDIGACTCFECWTGSNCENLLKPLENCIIDLAGGKPIKKEQYWYSKKLSFNTDYGYHASYINGISSAIAPNNTGGYLGMINQKLRSLHHTFNNYNTNDSYLVFGAGGIGLLNAAVYAYSRVIGGPIFLYSQPPYYPGLVNICSYLNDWCTFITDINGTDISKVVEICTYPNNPDGALNTPSSGSQYVIYDVVYHWPLSMPGDTKVQPIQYPLSIFSMTKFTGHASSRFGWAWVKNKTIADWMGSWTSQHSGVSSDGIARSLNVIDYTLTNKDEFVNTLKSNLEERWERVQTVLKDSQKLTIVSLPPTSYLFIKCNNVGDNCERYFTDNGMMIIGGSSFGVGNDHVRINIGGVPSVTFELFLDKLKKIS